MNLAGEAGNLRRKPTSRAKLGRQYEPKKQQTAFRVGAPLRGFAKPQEQTVLGATT